jgi:hypothetical protein
MVGTGMAGDLGSGQLYPGLLPHVLLGAVTVDLLCGGIRRPALGADGPTPDYELAGGQPDLESEQPSSDGADWAELDPRALDPDFDRFLASLPIAESVVVKLNRLLHGLLEREVLPLADRAAAMGVDPSPLLGVVSDLLRRYADALERPHDDAP